MEKGSKGWIEVVTTDSHALGRFVLLMVVSAVVLGALGAFFQWILRLERASKVEFSTESFAITYEEGAGMPRSVFTLIHTNRILPEEGIELKLDEPVTVNASGTVSTCLSSDLKKLNWNGSKYALMRDLVLAKYKFKPDSLPEKEEALAQTGHLHLYSLGLDSLVRQHEMDVNLQWRSPDGKLVCGVLEAEETDEHGQICGEARILPAQKWGYLLATVADDPSKAFMNLRMQVELNRNRMVASPKDQSGGDTTHGWVFPIGITSTFHLADGFVYAGKSGNSDKDKIARFEGLNPRLYLLVNDVFLDEKLLGSLTQTCEKNVGSDLDAIRIAEYKWLKNLFALSAQDEAFEGERRNKWKNDSAWSVVPKQSRDDHRRIEGWLMKEASLVRLIEDTGAMKTTYGAIQLVKRGES